MNLRRGKVLIPIAIAGALVAFMLVAWRGSSAEGPGEGFVSGNGRIEATEINASAKLAGRIEEILVREGDFVKAGQPLVRMQSATLQAQLDEARAVHQQALTAVANAQAQVAMRSSDLAAANAVIAQHKSTLDAAVRRLARTETLAKEGAASIQELDDDRARVENARATVSAAQAQAVAAQKAVAAARAQGAGAQANVGATNATIARVEADIVDSVLTSPRDGRVQYLIAQQGEVLAAGGAALNLIDLGDVYMTFFVPSTDAGRIAIGSEARIVLDAAPDMVIPAHVSFVASTAQFTPKTVETARERQKLMFRVRAQISRELLQQHLTQVKTGLPGVTWLKLDPRAAWPQNLAIRVTR